MEFTAKISKSIISKIIRRYLLRNMRWLRARLQKDDFGKLSRWLLSSISFFLHYLCWRRLASAWGQTVRNFASRICFYRYEVKYKTSHDLHTERYANNSGSILVLCRVGWSWSNLQIAQYNGGWYKWKPTVSGVWHPI